MFNITCSVTIRKPLVPLSEALRNWYPSTGSDIELVVPETSYVSSVALPQRHGTYEVSLTGTRVPVCLKAKKISILNLS